jgi:hypothetical protein
LILLNKPYRIKDNYFKCQVISFDNYNTEGEFYRKANLNIIKDKIENSILLISFNNELGLAEALGVVIDCDDTGVVYFKLFDTKQEWKTEILNYNLFLNIQATKLLNNEIIIDNVISCIPLTQLSNWDFKILYKKENKWKIRRFKSYKYKNERVK